MFYMIRHNWVDKFRHYTFCRFAYLKNPRYICLLWEVVGALVVVAVVVGALVVVVVGSSVVVVAVDVGESVVVVVVVVVVSVNKN